MSDPAITCITHGARRVCSPEPTAYCWDQIRRFADNGDEWLFTELDSDCVFPGYRVTDGEEAGTVLGVCVGGMADGRWKVRWDGWSHTNAVTPSRLVVQPGGNGSIHSDPEGG